jgi:hypothetical protein
MNRIIRNGGMAIVLASLAACSGAYPGSGDASYAALHNGTSSDASAQARPSQPCPGTNEAGGAWHPGGYCMPGGR